MLWLILLAVVLTVPFVVGASQRARYGRGEIVGRCPSCRHTAILEGGTCDGCAVP